MSEIAKSADGRFLPGNPWRYRAGSDGRPARFNYNTMRTKIIEFLDRQTEAEKPLTWAGLAAYLGISRHGLDLYRDGKVLDKTKTSSAIVDMLAFYQTLMEADKESKLQSKEYATSGIVFALKNQHGWTDTQHVEHTGQAPIQIAITSDSPLRGRLERAGVIVEQVDG